MKYTCYDMNAYKLHIINTNKFKTITVGVAFRRKIVKEEITIRNLLKEVMLNATNNYQTERDLIIQTENLYDLKLLASNYRVGNYAIMTFRTRFLNEKYTEKDMNEESIKLLFDVIFNPKLDYNIDKCKKKIEKSILSLKDNKIKYSIFKLLETTEDKPYAYNSYGYVDDLQKITLKDIEEYYKSVIKNDLVDVYVVGEVNEEKIKNIFKEYFKLTTFHKQETAVMVSELANLNKAREYREKDKVNQTQLAMLCNISELSDFQRKYVLPVYAEMLGGTSNSILFDDVREKNSYAYYVNAIAKPYDNILIIYSGIEQGNDKKVTKLILKSLRDISKGNFDNSKFENAKKMLVTAIEASSDSPMGIISNYYAQILVNSAPPEERIEAIKKITRDDIVRVSKKVSVHTTFILEGYDEENND